MALAAFQLLKCTGTNAATETDTSKATTFLNVDANDPVAANHPIQAPLNSGDSPKYAFECWLRLKCTGAPDNYVQNIKFFGPSTQPDWEDTPGNKLTVMAGTTATGATPAASASSIATVIQHTTYYSVATGLAIGVLPGDDKINAVGEYSDYIVLQLKVEYLVEQGTGANIVFNFSYEEV